MSKQYLGDGVYAEVVDYGIMLTTEDGIQVGNRILLDAQTTHELLVFIRKNSKSFACDE